MNIQNAVLNYEQEAVAIVLNTAKSNHITLHDTLNKQPSEQILQDSSAFITWCILGVAVISSKVTFKQFILVNIKPS